MNIIKMLTMTVVTIVLLCAVVIPITSSMAQETEEKVYSNNETYSYRMARGTSYSGTIAKTDSGFTLGGTAVSSELLIVSSTAAFRIYDNSGTMTADFLYKKTDSTFGYINGGAMGAGSTLVFNKTTWAYTPAEGSTVQTAPVSYSFDWVFYPSETGSYIRTSQPVNVDSGREFISFSFVGSHSVVGGSLTDRTVIYKSDSSRDPTVVYEASGYTNTLTSVKITNGGSEYSQSANLIVPLEYTSDVQQTIVTTLVTIIPVLLIVALLVAVVIGVISKREDY